jgi:lipoprotein-anchoring transpeptidase ErfK/SrfK
MQTIKTGVVIVLLIAVCYGAFVALNAPEADIPDELKQWANSADIEGLLNIEMPTEGNLTYDLSAAQPMESAPSNATLDSYALDATTSNLPALPPVSTSANPSEPATPRNLTEMPTFPETPPSFASEPATQPDTPTPLPATAPVLDGPAVPFTTAELPLPEKTFGEFVSTRNAETPVLNEVPADWSSSLGVSLIPTEESTADAVSPGSNSEKALPVVPFEIAREQALAKANAGAMREALEMLSAYYESLELGHSAHSDLVDILDALSREAIYSNRHLIQAAYTVKANDTLESVAQAHQITPELLAAINGMGDAKALIAGSQLKVIPGPFHATISVTRGELTLFLGKLYAGRFPISIGEESPPTEGVFAVTDRRRDRTYYGPGGIVIKAGEPENPFGGYWLNLGNNICIHGSPEMARSDLKNAGCISLAPLDAADVYNILTTHSQVEIRH